MARTHGLTNHPLFGTWSAMRQRCYDPAYACYHNYGGRGISICRRWRSFKNFYDDMLPSWTPGLTIDRRDNNGDYSPSNCKWSTNKEQSRNRRSAHIVMIDRKRMTLTEAIELFGVVEWHTAAYRIKAGWNAKSAVSTPPSRKNKNALPSNQ